MKLARTSGTLGLAALAAVCSPLALAEDTGWYGGINFGQSSANIDDSRISSRLVAGGATSASVTDDDRDTGYKVFGGYRFNRNFALEGGYFDLGKFGYTATTVPAGTLTGSIKLRGLNLDVVGIVPINEKFSAFGRIGLNHAEARDSFTGTGSVTVTNPNPSKRDTNYKFGLGIQYDFTPSLGMRVEAERYRINDAVGSKGDVDLVSVGLIYRFGGQTSAPARRAAAAEAVVAAAAPQPAAVTPAAPVPAKVAVSADVLLDFGNATVQPVDMQALDKPAADPRGASLDVITEAGRWIPPLIYDMGLSERRVEAIKTYLANSAGGRIAAR